MRSLDSGITVSCIFSDTKQNPVENGFQKHQKTKNHKAREKRKSIRGFFCLRKYHESRNRLSLRNAPPAPPEDQGDDPEVLLDNSKQRRKKMSEDDDDDDSAGGGNWVPSFEVGNFAREVEFRGPTPFLFHSLYSCNNNATSADQKQDDGKNESLDLKLAL
ncbi:hypothetical protein FF1_047252 [Malus domestica]